MKYKAKAKSGTLRDRTRWVQVLIVAYLLLLPFILSWQGFDNFRLPKTVFSSVSILVILGATVWLTRPELRMPLLSWETLFLAGLGYVGLHTVVSSSPGWSWSSFVPVLLFGAFFFCLRSVASPAFQRLTWLLVGTALAIDAVLCIFQFYGLVSGMTDVNGQAISGRLNPAGFLGDVNSGGFLFGLVSLVLVYFIFREERQWLRLFAGLLIALNLAGLAYSRTLTAVLGLALCGLLWLIFHHWWTIRQEKRFPRSLVYLWLVLIVVAGGAAVAGAKSGLVGRVRGVVRLAERGDWSVATAGRQPVYWLTWRMIEEKPWLGRGLNTFGRDFFYFRANTEAGRSAKLLQQPGAFREVHNDYLQVWEELGLPGLVILLSLFIIPLIRSIQLIPREEDPDRQYWFGMLSLAVIFVMIGCLAFFPLRLPHTAAYIILVFAGLRRYQSGLAEGDPARSVAWPRLVLALRVAVSLIVVLLGFREIRAWSANNDLGMANFLLQRAASGQFSARQSRVFADQALVRLDRAQSASPMIPDIDNQKGTAFMQLGRYDEAVESYRLAAERIPSPEVLTNLAAACLARRDLPEAERYIQLALHYDSEYAKAKDALRYLKDQRRQ